MLFHLGELFELDSLPTAGLPKVSPIYVSSRSLLNKYA